MTQRNYSKTVYVNRDTEVQLPPPKFGSRTYLLLQTDANGDMYVNTDTHADASNGITVPSGQFYERERAAPQNIMYVRGSAVPPTLQKILVTEGVE